MNFIFKLMIFSITLNLATGVMIQTLPNIAHNPANLGGNTFNEQDAEAFIGGMNESVNPSGLLEDKGDSNYRVLDMINVGFYQRFVNTVKQYAYGVIYYLNALIGPYLEQNIRDRWFSFPFGAAYVLLNIGYALAIFMLWTGKDVRS